MLTENFCEECYEYIDSNNKEKLEHCGSLRHTIRKDPIRKEQYLQKLLEQFKQLQQTIEENFSGRSFTIEACLSVKAQMLIDGITQVFTLIFMGSPSTYKSTILEIISALPNSYVSDQFTPKSFVSHSANSKKADLEKIDLLPRIKHKTLITPEMAPIFSGNKDLLIEYFGILTRILDGRGFQSDSGVHGQRGYQGDYYFTWLGAVIDIPHRVWSLLGNLGPKIYFFRLPADRKVGKEKLEQIKQNLKENSYTTKLASSKFAIKQYWDMLKENPDLQDEKIIWDSEKDDDDTLNKIIQLAMILASLRASIPTWQTSGDAGGTNYNFETPVVEDPSRASSALCNLAKGHALLHGRNYITKDDLAIVISVALSSAPKERVELLRLLIENNGKLDTNTFIEIAKVSRATALKEMEKLSKVGLVNKTTEERETKPVTVVQLKDEHNWILTPEFREHWNKFMTSLNLQNSKLSQKQENLEKNNMSKTDNNLFAYDESLSYAIDAS